MSALITENAIVPNAIVPNAIVPNAIVPNAIVPNALSPSTLDSGSLAAIQATGDRGDLSRMFLKYVIGCAFDPTQSFSFSWTDASNVVHNETYWGIAGIVPNWANAPLSSDSKQRLITSCLLARTNYSGTSVTISMRSPQNPLKKDVTDPELTSYPSIEGAFWGNIFASSPGLYACYDATNVAHSRAALRECATGHLTSLGVVLPCGPIALTGSCASVCGSFDSTIGTYTACNDPPTGSTTTQALVTIGLP
ncbi:MAG: hypothetical protein QM820_21230 [Minicystis sp.]